MSKKESIKILIEGEDQASIKVREAAQKTKEALTQIKQVGGQAKSSTEFIGVIARQLGGTDLGAFTGQLSTLIDKTKQFAEVSQLGGAGALAFHGGLVTLVGTMSFQLGQALGDMIFQTERWKNELAAAEKQALALDAALLKALGDRFSDSKIDIDLIADPDAKRAEYEKLLQDLGKEAAGIEQKIKQATDSIKNRDTFDEDANIFGLFGFQTESEKFLKIKEQEIAADRERLKLINEQTMALQKQLGERAKERELAALKKQEAESDERSLESLKKRLQIEKAINDDRKSVGDAREKVKEYIKSDVAKDASESMSQQEFEDLVKKRIEATAWMTKSDLKKASTQFEVQAREEFSGIENQDRAILIMEEIESMKILAEIEKEINQERKAAAAAAVQEANRIQSAYDRETASLEQQIVLLRDGKEAARQMALEKQGIAKEDAKRFVEMQRQLEEQQKTDTTKPTSTNTAQESRVMARGDVDSSPIKDTAKNTEESKKILDQMLEELKNQARQRTEQTEQAKVEFVGI